MRRKTEGIQFGREDGSFTLRAETWLPQAPEQIFPFFADAGNLDALTPPWLRFEILTPRPLEMRAGALIDYRLRLRGVPIRWRTRIHVWEPPARFVDEQLRGPYRRWIHEHTFAPRDGGTLACDLVRYNMLGGALVNYLFVKRDLEKVFFYRQQRLRELFPCPPTDTHS